MKTKLLSARDGFGKGLLEAGEKDDNVVVLTANLGESTRTHLFARRFPERFFDVGVAEQALVTIGAGMALYGKVPFITSYAVFSPGRTFEQIKVTISLNDVPVKIIGAHAGFGAGPYGATHQSLEDIAQMRVIPNMEVIVPCDFEEARKATLVIAKNGKPTYLRLSREESMVVTNLDSPFRIGKANVVRNPLAGGSQATIIGCGPILGEAILAAYELEKSGIETVVVNMHTIKPIDEGAIIHAARISGAIVTVEHHQIAGGLGSAVAEVVARNHPVPIEFVGVNDSFSQSGSTDELIAKFGLKAENIIRAVKKVIERKNS